MDPADSDRIARAPPYSGTSIVQPGLPVRDCHPLRLAFPDHSGSLDCILLEALQPRQRRNAAGLGSSRFARHYSGNRFFLSSPAGTEMFQFPAFALTIVSVRPSAGRVAPFGHPGVKACLRLTPDFRSLPRPSSPLEA